MLYAGICDYASFAGKRILERCIVDFARRKVPHVSVDRLVFVIEVEFRNRICQVESCVVEGLDRSDVLPVSVEDVA